MAIDEKMLRELTAYIRQWGAHLDHFFGGKFDLAGKNLLVVGSGWGTEVLWALQNGAAHVTGIDPRDDERIYIETALAAQDLGHLAALGRFLPDKGGRIFLFADPLFYASIGHHLPIGPWEHLIETQETVRSRVNPRQWREYRGGLNGMTITSFLEAVREAGLLLLELGIRPDPNLETFVALRKKFPPGIKPMDLCLSGISCTLAFPHNI